MNCRYCNKEYKLERHLLKHESSCKKRNDVKVNNELPEVKEELVGGSMQSKIDKLKVSISECKDAEYKYRLECELRMLEKSRD